jgi:hypothetical protein
MLPGWVGSTRTMRMRRSGLSIAGILQTWVGVRQRRVGYNRRVNAKRVIGKSRWAQVAAGLPRVGNRLAHLVRRERIERYMARRRRTRMGSSAAESEA